MSDRTIPARQGNKGIERRYSKILSNEAKSIFEILDAREIKSVEQIDSKELRLFLIWLDENGHNQGGKHACYRAMKAFLRWWELELEPHNWTNPIRKVPAPKLRLEPLKPVSPSDFKALLDTCKANLIGMRDKAILLLCSYWIREYVRTFLLLNLEKPCSLSNPN